MGTVWVLGVDQDLDIRRTADRPHSILSFCHVPLGKTLKTCGLTGPVEMPSGLEDRAYTGQLPGVCVGVCVWMWVCVSVFECESKCVWVLVCLRV